MSDNFFTKASAIVLTAAGMLGVGYGIAKYVTDFEAAKVEIQNLRGQIAQLHDLLSKVQFGADTARIERLETQVSELGKAVTTLGDRSAQAAGPGVAAAPVSVPAAAADSPAASPPAAGAIEAQLKSGGFAGVASDGKDTWPFRVSDVHFGDGTSFDAVVEWTTLASTHRIKGDYSDARLFFKETEFINKGNNHVLGCEYTLASFTQGVLAGTFGKCDGNFSGGTVEARLE